MNTLNRSLSMALLAAAAASAFAGAADADVQRVEVTAPRLAAAQAVLSLRDLDTTYEMSSGRKLVVSSFGDILRVRYARQPAATLRHDGQGNFVSHDGRLALEFEVTPSGDPQLVRLTMPAHWL